MKISSALLTPSFRRFAGGLIAVATLSLVGTAAAATQGTDNAGNYVTWTNGSNGGTGFGAWDLTSNSGSANAGYFLGSSTAGAGNVNSGNGNSFGIFGHDGTFATAARPLVGTLSLGQTFSIQLSINFRNGNKGFNMLNASGQVFNFNAGSVGGTDGYYYTIGTGTAVNTNFAYFADSVFTLAYTQQSATAGLFTISRTSAGGGAAATNSVSVPLTTSAMSSFQLYTSGTTDSSNQNNLYFNNLAVVPEPSAIALVAVGLTGLVVSRRRQR